MKIKNDQKGFGLIEALLILATIGALAGVGYYVYSNNKTEPEAQSSSKVVTPAKTEVTKTFEFKEMGVSIDLSRDIENLTYKPLPSVSSSSIPAYVVTTKEIQALFDKCTNQKPAPGETSYVRNIYPVVGNYENDLKAAQEANDQPSFPKLLKQFDTRYIAAYSPTGDEHGACWNTANDEKYRAMIDDADKALFAAFKNAKETEN